MKTIVAVTFLTFIFGCANPAPKNTPSINKSIDTAKYVEVCKELISFKKEIKIKNEKLHLSDSVNTVLSVLVLDYQRQIIAAKFNEIELVTIKKRFTKIVAEYNSLFQKLEQAAIENSLLKKDNAKAFETITVYKHQNEELEKEKADAKGRIKLVAAGVTIKAFKKRNKNFWHGESIDTTSFAKKTSYVEVSFIIPKGIPVDYKEYNIEVKLYTAVGVKGIVKTFKVLYNGNEWQHTSTFDDIGAEFRSGRHEAEILIDAKPVYNGTLNLK